MLPMKPRVVRTVLLCCLALLLMPVEVFAVSYVSNISVQDGVLSFTYERPEMPPDKTIVRFDLSFHAGSSSTEHGSAKYIAWAKANTGSYANYTSQGVTISLNGDTFTITVNFTTLRPYEGDSFQLDGLTAPNTHLWMRCAPCHDGSDEGLEQYVEWLYLGEFGSWQELSQSDYRIGNTYYKTLDDALAAAKANDTGANDYVTKPFHIEELFARIRVLARAGAKGDNGSVLKNADIVMDRQKRLVFRGGRHVTLTKTQFDLLEYFLMNLDIVLSREQLLGAVWRYDYAGDSNVVDVYVRYVRNRLGEPADGKLIESVRGIGYVMRSQPVEEAQ